MKKEEIKDFFNQQAPHWDADMIKDDYIIEQVLDVAKVHSNCSVLDVACGTGVLIDYYLKRDIRSVIGVDLSPKMISIAKEKYSQENIHFLCMDIEDLDSTALFDCIVIYNAFPHFLDGEKVIRDLTNHLLPNGALTIAHGMSRKKINHHHSGMAKSVSLELPSAADLAKIMSLYLNVTDVHDDSNCYYVSGRKKYN